MKHLFIFITLNLSFLIIRSCSENGVKPPPPEEKLCEITDSTSHDFTFVIDTVGVFPSALYDVAAIDHNNVWAVGVINTPEYDSVWNNPTKRHNAIKWNGSSYEYHQLKIVAFTGTDTFIQDLRVALAFSENNIWFFSGAGSYVHWNGTEWNSAFIWESKGVPKRAWGSSPDNFYLVGDNGSITHYNGDSFSLMESGTDEDLWQIAGYVDQENGKTIMWAHGDFIVLYYDGNMWETVWEDTNPYVEGLNAPGGIYIPKPGSVVLGMFKPSRTYGYCFKEGGFNSNRYLFDTDVGVLDMAGTSLSDLFLVGSHNEVAHFNGSTIKEYKQIFGDSRNNGVAYVDGYVFITGTMGIQQGLFIKGIRN